GRAEEHPVAVRDAVRADAGPVEDVLPPERAGRAVEGVDVAAQILEVDRVAERNRVARELSERARALELEPPLRRQARDVGGIDRARRGRAAVGEVEGVSRAPVREL